MANSISNLSTYNQGANNISRLMTPTPSYKPVAQNNTVMLMGLKPMNQAIVNSVKGTSINPAIPAPNQLTSTPIADKYSVTPGLIKTGGNGGKDTTVKQPTTTTPTPLIPPGAGNQQVTPMNQGGTSAIDGVHNQTSQITPNPSSFSGLVGRTAAAGTANPTQSGLVQSLQDTAKGNAQIGQDARAIADRYSAEINRVGGLGAGAVAGDMSTGTNVVGSGNANLASNAASARMTALGTAEQAALQGTGQQLTGQSQQANAFNNALTGANTQQQQGISALGTAANLSQPIQLPYGNQFVNPQTGEAIGGTGGSLQTAVQNVQQKLQAGQMSYDDAKAALAGYGQGGLDALNQSLPPGFNVAQSNVNAQQQGAVGPAMSFANTALNNVKNIMAKLPDIQNTNIPILNAITRGASTLSGVGSEQTRALTGAIQSLKNAYAALLASSKGGTPTDYGNQVNAEVPDNPTMNDIAAVERNMQVLGQARQNIYGNPGMSQGGSTGGGTVVNTSAGAINTNW